MVGREKSATTPSKRLTTTKWKHQTIEVDVPLFHKVWEEIPKRDLKSFQVLYDYLIVSGIIFLKRELIELVREKSKALKERAKNIKRQCLAGNKPGELVRKKFNPVMYEKDFEALGRFCIEENLKKHWVFESLLREFVEGNPIVLDHIEACKKLNITQRKKQLARVAKLEYIYMLDEKDAEEILKRNTERYDRKEFESSLLQEEVNNVMNRALKDSEDKETARLEDKIGRLVQRRGLVMEKIMAPVDLDDDDEEELDESEEEIDENVDEEEEEVKEPSWMKSANSVAADERKARKARIARLRKEIEG